jgi:CheY-like chemotaxis protein
MARPLVLLVDDSPELALIVQRLGKHAGHDVVPQGDVPAAWDYLQEVCGESVRGARSGTTDHAPRTTHPSRRPDLVLLDINLPCLSGVELCRRLRATPGLADLPVALFSHWDRAADILAGLEAGADSVLCKDLVTRPDDWGRRVGEILRQGPGRAATFSLHFLRKSFPCPLPRGMITAFNQALRQALPRQLFPCILALLLRRIGSPGPPEGTELDPERIGEDGCLEDRVALLAALAYQVECIVGRARAAPLWQALDQAVPGLEEAWRRG